MLERHRQNKPLVLVRTHAACCLGVPESPLIESHNQHCNSHPRTSAEHMLRLEVPSLRCVPGSFSRPCQQSSQMTPPLSASSQVMLSLVGMVSVLLRKLRLYFREAAPDVHTAMQHGQGRRADLCCAQLVMLHKVLQQSQQLSECSQVFFSLARMLPLLLVYLRLSFPHCLSSVMQCGWQRSCRPWQSHKAKHQLL